MRTADLGYRTLVISTDIAHSLADALAIPLQNEPRPAGMVNLHAAELDTGQELERYWGDIKRRIASVLRDEGVSATAAGELAIIPGLDEVLALVRIKRYYDEGAYDVLVIDSAPTGAAMRLLSAPDMSRWYTRHLLGLSRGLVRTLLPILRSKIKMPVSEEIVQQRVSRLFQHVEELRDVLADGRRTSVRLVLNPDHMSLQETQRAYTYMNLFGFVVDALFVNRVLPDQVTDPYFSQWKEKQAVQRARVRDLFAPLPVFEVPLLRQEVVGIEALKKLSGELYGGRDPAEQLSSEQPLRFYTADGLYMLAIRVAGVTSGTVDLEKQGDVLRVKLGRARRSLVLPQYLAGLDPAWAKVEGDYLKVAFDEASAPSTT